MEREKMKKMNQICKQDPIFWFVGEVIHEIRGTVPYGGIWGYFGPQEGAKTGPQTRKKPPHIGEKIKKIEIINNQGPLFFCLFQAQMIKFGVEVHMETFVANIGIEGGQK